ncbi:DNA-binding IclR family transcriptional regulator [Bradyrhizobium diazoefficiens]|uniref:IclR family transcriptional regulator n=1 Tax=Bradyrhizobium diazoefficiens TaxID=1355477 RepID=UPI003516A1FB
MITKKARKPSRSSSQAKARKAVATKARKGKEREDSGSSLSRMLRTLQFFSRAEPVLSAETIAERAGVPTSTAYRYVKQLTNAGLLIRWKGGFALGPRIMELDLQIRECDPLIVAAAGPMVDLAKQTGLDVLLSKLYGQKIITVHIEPGGSSRTLNFGRGRPLPLFRGSNSKAIVAFLPAARMRKLHEEARANGESDPLARDWQTFYERMLSIRKAGYSLTKGELNSGIEGISAPIFGAERDVIGSLTLIGDLGRMAMLREEALIEVVQKTTAVISESLK